MSLVVSCTCNICSSAEIVPVRSGMHVYPGSCIIMVSSILGYSRESQLGTPGRGECPASSLLQRQPSLPFYLLARIPSQALRLQAQTRSSRGLCDQQLGVISKDKGGGTEHSSIMT